MYLGRAFSWIKSLHSSAELIVKFPTATRNVITEVLVSSTVYRINTNTQCLEKARHYIFLTITWTRIVRAITTSIGTLITHTICHQMTVSFSHLTCTVQLSYLGKLSKIMNC